MGVSGCHGSEGGHCPAKEMEGRALGMLTDVRAGGGTPGGPAGAINRE